MLVNVAVNSSMQVMTLLISVVKATIRWSNCRSGIWLPVILLVIDQPTILFPRSVCKISLCVRCCLCLVSLRFASHGGGRGRWDVWGLVWHTWWWCMSWKWCIWGCLDVLIVIERRFNISRLSISTRNRFVIAAGWEVSEGLLLHESCLKHLSWLGVEGLLTPQGNKAWRNVSSSNWRWYDSDRFKIDQCWLRHDSRVVHGWLWQAEVSVILSCWGFGFGIRGVSGRGPGSTERTKITRLGLLLLCHVHDLSLIMNCCVIDIY